VPAPTSHRSRPLPGLDVSGTRRCGGVGGTGRIREPRHRRCACHPALPHRIGQCDEVVLVRIGRQGCGVPHQLPAQRGGDAAGVPDTQIPGVRFAGDCHRTHDSGRVRVDVGQRCHRELRAPGSTTAAGKIHVREIIVGKCTSTPDTRSRRGADVQPLPATILRATAPDPSALPRPIRWRHDRRSWRYDLSSWPIPAVPREAVPPTGAPAAAGTCVDRSYRRRFPVGAAARSASTWRSSRPTSRSSAAGNSD